MKSDRNADFVPRSPGSGCLNVFPLPFTPQGMLKGDDLSAAYASADIFVMPSESETLGFVAMEAMSSGLPVVAVAAGGLVDILRNTVGEAGENL